jgi:hypothetical protein
VEELLRSEEVAEAINILLAEDRARGIWWVPIRHHSPACALHVSRLIEAVRPKSVMIEGPEDFDALIPTMLDPRTKTPFAAYCTYVDVARKIKTRIDAGPLRFGGYYPFCDYSPELVALRRGRAAGAELSFVDLTYPEKVLAAKDEHPGAIGLKVESLLEESWLKETAYYDLLAKKTGCRDHDELWDHLFEVRGPDLPTEQFIDEVAVYCAFSRRMYTQRAIEAEGNLAREKNMASHVAAAFEAGRTPIVVVTGGFHTVHLPELLRQKPKRRPRPVLPREEAITVLMRYGFDQLDALNGYSAGMPAPAYYDRVWNHLDRGIDAALARAAAEVLVDLSRETRGRKTGPIVSTAQAMDAIGIATQLAKLRGRPGPSREDVLDAVRSCFVKGSLDAEGALVMTEVKKQLAGRKIGFIPAEAGSPPIADDFHRIAAELGLDVSQAVRRESTLDLYRRANHRRTSRFFRALGFLGVPFAELIAGPDFAAGTELGRIQELWSWCWTPEVESSLIERMAYGATIAEAAGALLLERIGLLEQKGVGRSAREAVTLLVSALRMGLFDHVDRIAEVIVRVCAEDPSFASLVDAISELVLLESSREPLEAFRLPRLPELTRAAYRRATYLVEDLRNAPKEQEKDALRGLATLRALASPARSELDPALLHRALESAIEESGDNAAVIGGAAGLLYSDGLLEEARLLGMLTGSKTDFLRGVLFTAREVAWRVPGFVKALTALLEEWPEEDFLRALPELRLAFADLTPKETDKVATLVGREHGRDLGSLFVFDVTEEEAQANLQLTQRARSVLARDGLEDWSE